MQKEENQMSEQKNYFNNTKVANSMSKMIDLNQNFAISEYGHKNANMLSYINFTSKDLQELNCSITRFDLAVMDAIYSLQKNGKETFSIEMIANVMTGKTVKFCKSTSTKFEEIAKSIEKLSTITIKIDFTELVQNNKNIKLNKKAKAIAVGELLPMNRYYIVSPITNENRVYYKLNNIPVLYEYAELLGRVISVPSHILSIEGVREDNEFTIIKQQLIKEIELMKNENNRYKNTIITYEWDNGSKSGGFLNRVGIDKTKYSNDIQWRKRKSRLNEQIKIILEHLVSIQYISGFEFKKTMNSIVGVAISI